MKRLIQSKQSTLALGDVLLSLCALYAGYSLRSLFAPGTEGLPQLKAEQVPLFTAGVVFSSFLVELYSGDRTWNRKDRLVRITASFALSVVILSAVYYLLPAARVWRGTFALSLGSFSVLQFLWHSLHKAMVCAHGLASKVLVLGAGPMAQRIGGIITSVNHQHVLGGYYNCTKEKIAVPPDAIVGNGGGLIEVVRQEKPQKIVVSLSERRGALPVREMISCKLSGVEIIDGPTFYEQLTGKLLIEDLRPSWIIFSDGFRITPAMRLYKRLADMAMASGILLFALPLMPLIALAIKLDSRGPVLFRQKRVGERERTFVLIKFRTMKQDAEESTGPVWAQKNDQRVTRIGTILRKTRLDELPQVFNVLSGEMSLIGPRPERPEFVEQLKQVIPYYSERHFIKPGLTGWAQIKYPYGASVEDAIEKLKFDLFYIKNLSPLLDLTIFLETIKVVLFGRGGR